ncbi:MAG: preprotein translocase subunit SecG [Sphingomonadales bacterium]
MDQILLVVQGLIALALVGTILMQRSEGGALGIGGGPGGMMSARGAGNFLTKTTTILAVLFLGMCILLAIRSGVDRSDSLMEDFTLEDDPLAIEAPAVPTGPAIPEPTDERAEPGSVPETGPALRVEDALDTIDPDALAVPPVPEPDGQ